MTGLIPAATALSQVPNAVWRWCNEPLLGFGGREESELYEP